MDFLFFYTNILRAALIAATLYHLIQREYKTIVTTAIPLALTFLPFFLEHVLHARVDTLSQMLFQANLILSIYMGNGLAFFDKLWWWDRMVHFISGGIGVSFGLAFARSISVLSRFHRLAFGFTFSLAFYLLWEITEFFADRLFRADNQRWQKHHKTHNHQPTSAIQPAGLVDTMHDAVSCLLGALLACVIWWFVL